MHKSSDKTTTGRMTITLEYLSVYGEHLVIRKMTKKRINKWAIHNNIIIEKDYNLILRTGNPVITLCAKTFVSLMVFQNHLRK